MKAQICLEALGDKSSNDQDFTTSQENQSNVTASANVESKEDPNEMRMFGTCLDRLVEKSSKLGVPFILSRLCDYIEKYGLLRQHLFQDEEAKAVERLKKEFNECGDASLESEGDVIAASKLLKLFLEELPEPLIPFAMQVAFVDNMQKYIPNSSDCIKHLRCLVEKLPSSAFCVLKYLSHFLLQVSKHEDANGLSSVNLGVIFGPLIFRTSNRDSIVLYMMIKNVTHCFVSEYYAIFEDLGQHIDSALNLDSEFPTLSWRKVAPFPSSIAPVIPMEPLKVVIPPVDAIPPDEALPASNSDVPVLIIESQFGKVDDCSVFQKLFATAKEVIKSTIMFPSSVTRKRKEKVNSEQCLSNFSSKEHSFVLNAVESVEILRDNNCKSSKDRILPFNKPCTVDIMPAAIPSTQRSAAVDVYLDGPFEVENHAEDSSPHPPDAKRRELEIFDYQQSLSDSEENQSTYHDFKFLTCEKAFCKTGLRNGEEHVLDNSLFNAKSSLFDGNNSTGNLPQLPRSASCPTSISESDAVGSDTEPLSMSWNKLFDVEEPVCADHQLSWPLLKDNSEDSEIISPLSSLHRLSSYEAPLSPSAYKSYLSYRSSHLDPSIPPSPPTEQHRFRKTLVKGGTESATVKQLSKKIHSLKKKLRRFDERYEAEYGYKPSQAEKTNFPEAKKLMSDLHKARKDLKVIKEESHFASLPSFVGNWHSARDVHILEDTTNCQDHRDYAFKSKPSVQASWGETLKSLEDDRRLSCRPESIEEMTTEQVKDEKLAIQKVLLRFESIHGKPTETSDRNTIRPLYERYRNIKHIVRCSSFPVSNSKANATQCLQPIIEHEAMDFTVPQKVEDEEQQCPQSSDELQNPLDDVNVNIESSSKQESTNDTSELDIKYNNSNLHELPIHEMVSQQQQARFEKRRLRKILREFEAEFLRISGRKVKKEDKLPVEALYAEYKLVKARLRLLEALMSKHDEPKLA